MIEGQLFRKVFLRVCIGVVGLNMQAMNNTIATFNVDVADRHSADECEEDSDVDLILQSQLRFAPIRQSLEPCFLTKDIGGQSKGAYTRLLISMVSLRNPIGVRSALENNANPSAIMYTGESVLTHAAKRGDTRIVKLLLWCKAEVNSVTKSNKTPLIEAVLYGSCGRYANIQDYCEVAWGLVIAGGDVSAQTKTGHTAFELATPIIKETIEHALEIKEWLACLEHCD